MHKENEPLLKTSNEISPCRVDVFGSCVSRSIFLNGIPDARGCADPRIKINRYFFRHSILSCMTPPPNTTELNADIAKTLSNDSAWTTEYYFKALKEELLKSVLPMIRESDGDYFVFDMYDMFTRHVLYDNTILAPIDTVLFSLDAFQNKNNFSHFFPYDYPIGLWYGYIKLFMDEIVEKYGNEHVILVRLRACHSYISKSNEILPIPPEPVPILPYQSTTIRHECLRTLSYVNTLLMSLTFLNITSETKIIGIIYKVHILAKAITLKASRQCRKSCLIQVPLSKAAIFRN